VAEHASACTEESLEKGRARNRRHSPARNARRRRPNAFTHETSAIAGPFSTPTSMLAGTDNLRPSWTRNAHPN
jgi:hypothetical protein